MKLDLKKQVLDGVREYNEEYPVSLIEEGGRWAIQAFNEGGYNCTCIDLLDLLKALNIEVEI